MKTPFLILFLFFSLSSYFSFGQKKDKWIVVQGKVVDTLGQSVANERVALINKRGNDKKIVVTNKEGNFSFRIKNKNIDQLFVKCYSGYVKTARIKLADFLNDNCRLVLNFAFEKDGIRMHRSLSSKGCFVTYEAYKPYKNYGPQFQFLSSTLLPNGQLVILNDF